ncbi:hypothetical protein M3Y99_01169000 [Aphelenchoides fujianensis]|nr:hypothetical protein M3Y99_01169000 [Aphelenchoides fujianensis]
MGGPLAEKVRQLEREMHGELLPQVLQQLVFVVITLFLVILVLNVALLLMLIVMRASERRNQRKAAVQAPKPSIIYRFIPVAIFNHPARGLEPTETEAPHTSELPPTVADADIPRGDEPRPAPVATKSRLTGVHDPAVPSTSTTTTTRRRLTAKDDPKASIGPTPNTAGSAGSDNPPNKPPTTTVESAEPLGTARPTAQPPPAALPNPSTHEFQSAE